MSMHFCLMLVDLNDSNLFKKIFRYISCVSDVLYLRTLAVPGLFGYSIAMSFFCQYAESIHEFLQLKSVEMNKYLNI